MRTLLHAPRTRKRSIAAATLGALALVGSLLVATPAQAINDTGTGGVFVPASGRVLDTKAGTGGFTTPMEAGKYRTIKIAGVAGIPNDGTVGAVSLNATVSGTPSAGTLFGRPDADTSRTTMLIYNANTGEYVSNTAIVAVSAAGTIQVSTETAARLILDVQGYYTANTDGTAAGGFVPVAGKRIVDTRSGLGAPKALLAPGKSVDIQVTGANGVPAGASSAVVNLLPINSTASDGYLTPYATGTTRPDNALHYAPSVNTSIQAQVRLSSSGKMTIYNGSSTINLVIDLQGYFTKAGVIGATFTPGIGRVFDSRATGNTILAKNETRAIQVAGQAGVPVMGSGITAVVLTLTAAHGGSDGRASVWANGTTQPETTSINFQTDEIRTNTVTVALGANGKINLNNVADPTNYVIDVQGWYVDPTAPTIGCAAPFAAGSWVRDEQAQANGVTCTVTAPAASTSSQELQFIVNGALDSTEVLNESGRSTFTYNLQYLTGIVTIEAVVTDGTTSSATTSTQFGVGSWDSESLIPSTEDGAITEPTIALFPFLSTSAVLPSDARVSYTLVDETTGAVRVEQLQDEPLLIDDEPLIRGHSYAWSTIVHAANSWGTTGSLESPSWHFRVAEEGEATTQPGFAAEGGGMSVRAAPNGCTKSPDRIFLANFKPACDAHDICYGKNSKTSRLNCDKALKANMLKACYAAYGGKVGAVLAGCPAWAGVYYAFVRKYGKSHYVGKGSKA
ncbi:phospholipase A2 [Curtobacterium sp. AB7]|uniref:phospholipase A2 n=1 Tax=Curtobacterium sp. AB7 TaxID=3349327 RepID=UPI003834DA02